MSSTSMPARRTLVLGGAAGAASMALGAAPALAAGSDGGPDLGAPRDSRGFPLPTDPKALPNTTGRTGSGTEGGTIPGKSRQARSASVMAVSSVPNYPASTFPTLRPGAGVWDTRALQYLLLSGGQRTNWETTYGASTTAAVSAYQRAAKLPVTGIADNATLARLTPATGVGAVAYRVFAIQTLLRKHNYRYYDAPDMSTTYGPTTTKHVKSFQAGHGIGPTTYVGYTTWRTLFAAKTSEAMYPLRQAGTGNAQWSNCGPVSAVTLLIHRGKTPRGWGWNTDLRTAAVRDFRYNAMGVPNNATRDRRGTEFPDFAPAFASYGLTAWHGGINDTIANARIGKGSVCGGDAYALPWDNHANGPVSHWIAVLGWDGAYYLAMDPLSTTATDRIHRMTEAQLRKYASTNPGHPISTASKNSILLR